MDELDNIISLCDEEGNEHPFEFLDLLDYEGESYIVLLPVPEDPDEDTGEVVILRVEETEDAEHDNYLSVEDEKTLNAVYDIFREKFKDVFDFED